MSQHWSSGSNCDLLNLDFFIALSPVSRATNTCYQALISPRVQCVCLQIPHGYGFLCHGGGVFQPFGLSNQSPQGLKQPFLVWRPALLPVRVVPGAVSR